MATRKTVYEQQVERVVEVAIKCHLLTVEQVVELEGDLKQADIDQRFEAFLKAIDRLAGSVGLTGLAAIYRQGQYQPLPTASQTQKDSRLRKLVREANDALEFLERLVNESQTQNPPAQVDLADLSACQAEISRLRGELTAAKQDKVILIAANREAAVRIAAHNQPTGEPPVATNPNPPTGDQFAELQGKVTALEALIGRVDALEATANDLSTRVGNFPTDYGLTAVRLEPFLQPHSTELQQVVGNVATLRTDLTELANRLSLQGQHWWNRWGWGRIAFWAILLAAVLTAVGFGVKASIQWQAAPPPAAVAPPPSVAPAPEETKFNFD